MNAYLHAIRSWRKARGCRIGNRKHVVAKLVRQLDAAELLALEVPPSPRGSGTPRGRPPFNLSVSSRLSGRDPHEQIRRVLGPSKRQVPAAKPFLWIKVHEVKVVGPADVQRVRSCSQPRLHELVDQ